MLAQEKKSYGKKVAIIGVGYVGAGIAYALMLKDTASEIVLIDSKADVANAEMLDIRHGISNMGRAKVYCGDYSDISDCDLIVVTAGRNRRPNETRLDMASDNIKIAESTVSEMGKYYKQGVILVVSNPVDVITHYIAKEMNLPEGRVFGTGCILDSSRLISLISEYVGLTPEFISATIVGEHGNSQVALWDEVKVSNIPFDEFCNAENLVCDTETKEKMAKKVLTMGTEIIGGKGKTYYGIATCVCYLADAILNKRCITACVSSSLAGKKIGENVTLSLPSLVDGNGVKLVLPIDISEKEKIHLKNSSEQIKNTIKLCGIE